MKCNNAIRATKEFELGEIKRVEKKTAHSMVGYSWQYVSKTEWKLSRGKKVIEEVTDQVTDKVTDKVEKKPYKKGSKPEKKSK
jgi:hypothetical protein